MGLLSDLFKSESRRKESADLTVPISVGFCYQCKKQGVEVVTIYSDWHLCEKCFYRNLWQAVYNARPKSQFLEKSAEST